MRSAGRDPPADPPRKPHTAKSHCGGHATPCDQFFLSMSTTAPATRQRECQRPDCTETGRKWEFQDGYCSPACERADDLLSTICHDHRFCSICFRPRKTVHRPADSESPKLRKKSLVVREAFVGFEEHTEFVERGPYGLECDCGGMDHADRDEFLRSGTPYEFWLKLATDQLRAEGAVDYHFDLATFCDHVWAADDFGVAVGKALST